MTVESARAKPVHTVLSGPAGGVVAGAHFAGLVGADNIITMDIGGTSTDISLIRNGRPETTRQRQDRPDPRSGCRSSTSTPSARAAARSPGSTTAARCASGRSAPRPCRGPPATATAARGRPISDANLVLGRLGGETRLGGNLRLDRGGRARGDRDPRRGAARASTWWRPRPASCASRTPTSCAASAWSRSSAATTRAGARWCRSAAPGRCTARRWRASCSIGADRRAAGARHPVRAGPAALRSAPRPDRDAHLPLRGRRARSAPTAIARRLIEAGDRLLEADRVPRGQARGRGARRGALRRARATSCRSPSTIETPDAWARLAGDFHAAHRARFGHADPEAPIEIVGFGATAIGKVDAPELPTLRAGERDAAGARRRLGTRRVFFEGARSRQMPAAGPTAQVLARDKLLAGNEIAGPGHHRGGVRHHGALSGRPRPRACQRRAAGGVLAMTITRARVRSDHARGAAQRARGHGPGDGRAC